MAHDTHTSHTALILKVFAFLSLVTIVEAYKTSIITPFKFFRNKSFKLDFSYLNFGKSLRNYMVLYAHE